MLAMPAPAILLSIALLILAGVIALRGLWITVRWTNAYARPLRSLAVSLVGIGFLTVAALGVAASHWAASDPATKAVGVFQNFRVAAR